MKHIGFPRLFKYARAPAWAACALWMPAAVATVDDFSEEITIRHIAQGIRHHVAEQSHENGGYFVVDHDGRTLRLKLIRIHMEYLANLGDGVQFACVDLVEQDGTVYDVDFFLKGNEPGSLEVTQTHVHKVDGRPRYAWEQAGDGTWHRIDVAQAPDELLGVIRGQDAFSFVYRYEIPAISGAGRLWLPYARFTPAQEVTVARIEAPVPWRVLKEPRYGNQALYMEVSPEFSGETIEVHYRVRRREVSPYPADPSEPSAPYLQAERLVPINDTFRGIAGKLVSDGDSELMRARELYKHAVATIRYARYGEGWGRGDAVYACDVQSGNCTDFHAYFIALARAAEVPARFIMGAAIPSERNQGGVDGYHCWAEFYADGQWWPVDVSEANKHPMLADYYFGRNPANRFEFNRGRDLVFEPGPASGPINFLAYPVLEVDGVLVDDRPVFEFQRLNPDG
jgi:transglutaminase-like putative cysteine protease